MKKSIHLATRALLFAGALWLGSCQREFDQVGTTNDSSTSFSASSELAGLIRNVASFDGSFDNIVDRASCLALNFPYTVTVNGIELEIGSPDDLQMVEDIFDEFEDDTDILEIHFPVMVTLADYSEMEIIDLDELNELGDACVEGGQDDDNECIDFVYPITLFSFDLNNTQTGKVIAESDQQLRRFFNGLGESDIISLEFPVKLQGDRIQTETGRITVKKIEQLTTYLKTFPCDEDDDDNYSDDDFVSWSPMGCPWEVLSLHSEGIDLSEQYSGFWLTFYAGDAWFGSNPYVGLRDRYGNTQYGEYNWANDTDGMLRLNLSLPTPVFVSLSWTVTRIGQDRLRLSDFEGNRFEVQLNCDNPEGLQADLAAVLQECSWVISQMMYLGEDTRLLGYELEFRAEGVVNLIGSTTINEGTWEVVRGSEEGSVVAFTFGEAPELSFEWNLLRFFDNYLRFVNGDSSALVINRLCDSSVDPLLEQVGETLMNGTWQVASFTRENDDQTGVFAGFTFSFGAEHRLEVSSEANLVKTGLWRVTRNNFGGLTVFLNLGDDGDLLSDLTLDWNLVSTAENRIELKEAGTPDGFSVLVFEK